MIRYAVFLAVGIPATAAFSALAVGGGVLGAPHGFYDWIHRTWSAVLLQAAGVGIDVRGLEHVDRDGPQVLVANHESLLDILALLRAMPVSLRFVAKMELARVPVFGAAMRRAGHVFIDRGNRMQAVEAMRRAGDRIRAEGLTLGLFPEGTRHPEPGLRTFRRGSFVLAIETRTTLVPVAVHGGADLLSEGRRRLRAGTVRIRCGEPVDLEGFDADDRGDRDRLIDLTRSAIASMLDDLPEEGEDAACGAPGRRAP